MDCTSAWDRRTVDGYDSCTIETWQNTEVPEVRIELYLLMICSKNLSVQLKNNKASTLKLFLCMYLLFCVLTHEFFQLRIYLASTNICHFLCTRKWLNISSLQPLPPKVHLLLSFIFGICSSCSNSNKNLLLSTNL